MKNDRYAVILGNLGNTCDRFCDSYKDNPETLDMLKQAASIPDVSGIELVGTWDIRPENVREMSVALNDLGLKTVSIIPDLFANRTFWKGAYTSRDPKIRRQAIDYTRRMCDVARELSCPVVNLWPGQDGYDYLLSTDYDREREWESDAVREIAEAYPDLRIAMEYKPKEPRTHSYLARMADTLLVARETGCDNVGVTIDTGHAFVGGEVVAESIVLARRAGNKLFHMHFNDNFTAWDDDMIVGTNHSVAFIEMLFWLDKCGYDGWLSMDQYPYREDAAGAIGESIQWIIKFNAIQRENRERIEELIRIGDPVETSRFLRGVF